jgi:hypothetical protein
MTDVTKLDWRRWYRDTSSWPHRTAARLFLAEAVLRIAPQLIFPWDDVIVAGTMAEEQPLLPGSLDAFDWDENPKPEIHGAWAPAVLAYMSAAEFTSQQLEWKDPGAWLAAQAYDPVLGRMVFDPSKAYTSGTDVSFAHWNTASLQAAEINELRQAGIVCMPLLARAIAQMAISGDIDTIARPIRGGEEVRLTTDHWLIDDALHRIASCALNLDSPYDVEAEATHWIFVDSEGFDTHAALYARRNMISLIEEGVTPADVGMKAPSKKALYPLLVSKALPLMKAHVKANPRQYQRSVLRQIVENKLGPVSDGVFEAARDLLRKEYPHIADGGAPVGTERRRVTNVANGLKLIDGGKP